MIVSNQAMILYKIHNTLSMKMRHNLPFDDGFKFARNVDTSFSPFGHQTQINTIYQFIASYLHVRGIYGFCDLRVDLRIRLATLRMSPYASSGFANLRRLESPFGQGFIVNARIEIQAKYNATTMVKSTACLTKRTYDSDMHLR